MAKNGFKVMDSDMHILEPPDLWQRYIDPSYRSKAPIGLTRHIRDLGVEVQGNVMARSADRPRPSYAARREAFMRKTYAESLARNFDPVSQVMAMDKEGIDVAVLFPSRGLFVLGSNEIEPGLAAAIAHSYNDWLHDFCQEAPDRMYGAAMIAPHDVKLALSETRRTVEEYGFKSIFLRPNHVLGRLWSDACYDPLWAECERLEVPVGFHDAGCTHLPQPAAPQFAPTFTMMSTLGLPMSALLACADMIFGGVLERFPKLRVAFLEANCSWLPWFLWRMGEYAELVGRIEHPELKREPVEYFRRQCYASVECEEVTAKVLPEFGLEDNAVFSTDYPHFDVKYPHAVETFMELPFSDETKRKYLWDNCARLYGF
jgi:predicted TIM-barrel fold metal-dependent hydrolase